MANNGQYALTHANNNRGFYVLIWPSSYKKGVYISSSMYTILACEMSGTETN